MTSCDKQSVGVGAVIGGRYQLVRGIGAGGMGEVWEATHKVTGKRVAIKVLNAAYAKQPSLRARFLLEARAACRVRHPNVVQVHDVLELADGAPAMVMDFLEGEALSAKLERDHVIAIGPLATILAPVVDAMAAAHALGIVHRDLKPDNLFLERLPGGEMIVKVLDFGIAKVARGDDERDSPALTGTGAVLGTPYYMSPEQTFGERDLDYRSDVWSLGIILYECLTGRRPTEAENFGQIFKAITTGSIPPLRSVAPHVPSDVADLVSRMLKCNRTERPALREVLEVLRRHASALPPSFAPPVRVVAVSSAPTDLSTQNQLDETAPACETASEPPAKLPRRPARALRWGAAAACILALAGAAFTRSSWSGGAAAPSGPAAQAAGLVATPVAAAAAPAEAAPQPPIVAEPAVIAPVRPAVLAPKKVAPPASVTAALAAAPSAAALPAAPSAAAPRLPAAPAGSNVGILEPTAPF